MWDLASGDPARGPLTGHTGWVCAVAVGEPDGRPVIVSGGDDGTVRVWDLASRRPGARPAHRPRRRGEGGGGRPADGPPGVVSGGDDGTVRVWDLAPASQRGDPLTGHDGAVLAVAVGARRAARGLRRRRRDGAGVGPGRGQPSAAARSPATTAG